MWSRIINFCRCAGFIATGSAAVALAIMVLTFAANIAALSSGSERVKSTLTDALNDGSFIDSAAFDPQAIFSVRMGREIHYYPLECFIWTTLLTDPPGGLLVKVLRTTRFFPSGDAIDSRAPPSPTCQAALQSLTSDSPGAVKPELSYYDRYIIGQRAIAQILLEHFPVRTVTTILKIVDFSAFALVLILALRKRNAVIACIAALVLLFGGLNYYGGLLFFAPLDLAHACVLLVAIYVPFGTTSPSRLVLIGAVYGSVIAIFEALSGGIPMALVLLALLTGTTAADRSSLLKRFAILAFAFTVAVTACFLIKIIAAAAAFDPGTLFRSESALFFRIHGETSGASREVIDRLVERAPELVRWLADHDVDVTTNPIAYLILNYGYWSFLIGWGSSVFGVVLVLFGLASLIVSTVYLGRRGNGGVGSPGLTGCWLGILVVLAWVAVFWNHTIIHAFFMGRLLLLPLMCGCVAGCLTI